MSLRRTDSHQLEAELAEAKREIARLEEMLEGVYAYDGSEVAEVSLHSAHPGRSGGCELDGGGYERVRLPEWGNVVVRASIDLKFNIPSGRRIAYCGHWDRDGKFLGSLRLDQVTEPMNGPANYTLTVYLKGRIISA